MNDILNGVLSALIFLVIAPVVILSSVAGMVFSSAEWGFRLGRERWGSLGDDTTEFH